jgi:hypothetical protein
VFAPAEESLRISVQTFRAVVWVYFIPGKFSIALNDRYARLFLLSFSSSKTNDLTNEYMKRKGITA